MEEYKSYSENFNFIAWIPVHMHVQFWNTTYKMDDEIARNLVALWVLNSPCKYPYGTTLAFLGMRSALLALVLCTFDRRPCGDYEKVPRAFVDYTYEIDPKLIRGSKPRMEGPLYFHRFPSFRWGPCMHWHFDFFSQYHIGIHKKLVPGKHSVTQTFN